jgi:hypothetical protein
MKTLAARLLTLVAFVACTFAHADGAALRQFTPADVAGKAEGVGSLPSVILRDGTVCAIDRSRPSQCAPLVKVPQKLVDAISKQFGQFDGLFDLLGDGPPQIFINYWPTSSSKECPKEYQDPDQGDYCDAIELLVFQHSRDGYRPYLTLYADSLGYAPGAWFLNESPRKAIFQTRCVGSSGMCLYYLSLPKRVLDQIEGTATLQSSPTFEYFKHDRNAAIFVTDRGYDRNGAQGAALIHWTGHDYRQWWPDWYSPPYVMYARLVHVGGDSEKEIIAVLDSADERGSDVEDASHHRELGIWKLNADKWQLVTKTPLASVADIDMMVAYPTLDKITPDTDGAQISLSNYNGTTFICRYAHDHLTCLQPPHTAK